jgi:hypothetical protein
MYLTPERFRTMGFGIDLSDPESPNDIEIRSVIQRATAAVNAYCCVPMVPQQFDFRGGSIVGEAHEWSVSAYDQPRPYRYWPVCQPVKTVDQFRIYATPNVYTEIAVADMFINNNQSYIEVSSLVLTQYGIFGAGVVQTLIGMYNPVAKANYTYGWEFSVTDEILEPTDAWTYRAQNQFWIGTPTVELDGVVQSTGFTFDATEGTVTFAAPLTPSNLVTCSYTYPLPPAIAQATGMIATDILGERLMAARDMIGVAEITAGEITIRRQRSGGSAASASVPAISTSAASMLSPFIFQTVR